MKKLAALIFTLLATPAFASWIAPVDAKICTRDYNPWGKASICQCPHATVYDKRIGQCVQGAPVEVTVEGQIAPELNLDGDVVAYKLSKTEGEVYKIVMPLALRATFNDASFQGPRFRIYGEIIENFDGSIDAEPTIIVTSLEVLDLIPELLVPNLPQLEIAE